MGRLLAARPDPAVVLVPGRRRPAVLDRAPAVAEAAVRQGRSRTRVWRALVLDRARRLPAVGRHGSRPTSPSRTRCRRSAWATRSCSCSAFAAVRGANGSRSASILVGYWGRWALYPGRRAGLRLSRRRRAGRLDAPLIGLVAHWNKNANLGRAFDPWFLNLFPREKPFADNGGGYATLSFIPTLGTMILGLIAGGWLRAASPRDPAAVAARRRRRAASPPASCCTSPGSARSSSGSGRRAGCSSAAAGASCCSPGFSLGDRRDGLRRWAFPLVVIGMNSIAAYVIAHLWEVVHRLVVQDTPGAGHLRHVRHRSRPVGRRHRGARRLLGHALLDVQPQGVLADLNRDRGSGTRIADRERGSGVSRSVAPTGSRRLTNAALEALRCVALSREFGRLVGCRC